MQAGDIVKGGLQDRVFAYDVIVPAKSGKIPTGAFCVEQGRWSTRRAETGEEEPSVLFCSSAERVHTKDLKFAVLDSRSQAEVWDKVSEAQDKLSAKLGASVRARRSATSLQLTLENEKVETQKWNLNPSWKMRWGNPPVAINFLFEVVRMFVPVRTGAPMVGSSGLLEFTVTGAV